MSIFGEETITPLGSPEDGQDEGAAGQAGNDETSEFDHDDGADADLDDEGGEQDEQLDDEQDSSPSDDGQGDELILGKFRTQEDLAKAYQSLQRQFTQERQAQTQPPATSAQAPQQPGDDPNQTFWTAFRDNPLETFASAVEYAVNQRLAPIQEERQAEVTGRHLTDLAKEYKQLGTAEGVKLLASKIQEAAAELGNPGLAQHPTPRLLRMAAQEAFGDSKASAFQKGKDAARAEAERNRQAKQGLGAKAGARRQQDGEKTPEQSMKEAILAAGKGGGIFG